MLIFLLVLLPFFAYSSEVYFDETSAQNIKRLFHKCEDSLTLYNDFLPGTPALSLLSYHPDYVRLIQQIANQEALWQNREDRVHLVLVQMIRNRTHSFSKEKQIQTLSIFLTAAEQKGHFLFVNRITEHNDTILKASIETNNDECKKVARQYHATR